MLADTQTMSSPINAPRRPPAPPVTPASFAATLPTTTATEMKRQGWRSVMANVRRDKHVLITNHNAPEAVILAPEEYDRLVNAARNAATAPDAQLEALRMAFRARLQCLQEPGANEKLANLMGSYPKLNGRVLAGESY